MADGSNVDRLSSLEGELSRSLDGYLGRLRLPVRRRGSRRAASTARGKPADTPTSVAALGHHAIREAGGGTVFSDDERALRALAKQIKRLISEDDRRGLRG